MNIKLLLKVKKHILAEPRRLDMGIWAEHDRSEEGPVCGTVACIAGWAVLLSHPRKQWNDLIKKEHDSTTFPIHDEAQKLLRLDDRQASVLFSSWCPGVRGTKWYALYACERIDELIAKHKED